jgi:hypothetical protein
MTIRLLYYSRLWQVRAKGSRAVKQPQRLPRQTSRKTLNLEEWFSDNEKVIAQNKAYWLK